MPVKKAMLKRVLFLLCTVLIFSGCAGVKPAQSEKKSISKTSTVDDGFIHVKGGLYKDKGGITHEIRSFYLSPYEITQSEWKMLMKVNPSEFNGTDPFPPFPGENQDKRPVEMISWFDALEFCNAKSIKEGLEPVYTIEGKEQNRNAKKNPLADGYRLPAAIEWEYAADAGGKEQYIYSGTNKAEGTLGLNAYAWFKSNAEFATHEIGLKLANALGFYDMSGNVFEWCEDEGKLGPSSRVWKGGGALSGPEECRIYYSGEYWPATRNSFTGLRLARNAY